MEIDTDKVDGDNALELEDASTTEEAPTPVATASLDSLLCHKFLDLPAPKVALSRTGVKSMRMEQMLLLRKMDVRRLMKRLGNKHDCHTH